MTKSRGIRKSPGTRRAWVEANQGRYLCMCGCGIPITLLPAHFNVGVPRYRHGHNPQPRTPQPVSVPCGCGCGALATPGKRFVSGHNRRGLAHTQETKKAMSRLAVGKGNPNFGKRPANYRGRQVLASGYVYIHVPDHPLASKKGYVMEHRLVLEDHLRRTAPGSRLLIEIAGEWYLAPHIEVHHINEAKDDNALANLAPMTGAEHTRLHHALRAAS